MIFLYFLVYSLHRRLFCMRMADYVVVFCEICFEIRLGLRNVIFLQRYSRMGNEVFTARFCHFRKRVVQRDFLCRHQGRNHIFDSNKGVADARRQFLWRCGQMIYNFIIVFFRRCYSLTTAGEYYLPRSLTFLYNSHIKSSIFRCLLGVRIGENFVFSWGRCSSTLSSLSTSRLLKALSTPTLNEHYIAVRASLDLKHLYIIIIVILLGLLCFLLFFQLYHITDSVDIIIIDHTGRMFLRLIISRSPSVLGFSSLSFLKRTLLRLLFVMANDIQ